MTEDWPTLEKFNSEIEAELAQGALAEAGIEAVIWKDDAGGMYPSFQQLLGVRLRVAPEDLERARQVLADLRAPGDEGADGGEGDEEGDGDA